MALATLKVAWTVGNTAITYMQMLTAIRDFLVTNGWTLLRLIDNGTYGSGLFTRKTVAGDDMYIRIDMNTYVTLSCGSGYVPGATVLTKETPYINGNQYTNQFYIGDYTTTGLTLLVSTDQNFIAMTAKTSASRLGLFAVCAYPRPTGDRDAGSHFGNWNTLKTDPNWLTVPQSWERGTWFNFDIQSDYNSTALGPTGRGSDGNDVALPLFVSSKPYHKFKGVMPGIRVTTFDGNGVTMVDGTVTPTVDGNAWYLCKTPTGRNYLMAYATPTVWPGP